MVDGLAERPESGMEADDDGVIAGVRTATPPDRARLGAAVVAVDMVFRPLTVWHGGRQDADGVTQLPFPAYHPAVDELVTALCRAHVVADFDWMHWDGALRYTDAVAVRRAPVADAVRLMTTFVRGERFSEGTIASALDDGRLVAATQRILDEW